jgi:Leucine-rich repeat (LRR) protein
MRVAKEILTEALLQQRTTESVLNLADFRLEDNDIVFICQWLEKNPHIKTLNVRGNLIGKDGAIALALNQTLTTLDVSFNKIGNDGAIAFAVNQTLTTLNVRNNNIGKNGAKALAVNQTLATLDVNNNDIGDDGAVALAGNHTLATLDVSKNNIGEVGEQALLKMETNPVRVANRERQNLGCHTVPSLAVICSYYIIKKIGKNIPKLVADHTLPASDIKELPKPKIRF